VGGDINIKYRNLGLVVCLEGLNGEQMYLLDLKYDDVPAKDHPDVVLGHIDPVGRIAYSYEAAGLIDTNHTGVAVDDGEICILY